MNYLLRAAGALLVPAFALTAAPANAQETFRIGFVNPDRVLREAQPAKNAQAKLEAEFIKRENDIKAQAASIKADGAKFERDAPTMSDSQRQQQQRSLMDRDREFQRRQREFQEDLNARKNEELQQVYERANRVVKEVAEAEKYDAILQEAIYINPKHDITEKVIRALNASVGVTSSGAGSTSSAGLSNGSDAASTASVRRAAAASQNRPNGRAAGAERP